MNQTKSTKIVIKGTNKGQPALKPCTRFVG
jgi:hypothetical protein